MDFDIAIIGGGAVGLAIGRELALRGREVYILETNDHYGLEASSRNSEVIHAGIYYPPGSLKSQLCIRGNKLLYEYLEDKKLPHRRCGKFIVAGDATEMDDLKKIKENATAAGVTDMLWVDEKEIKKKEPNIKAVGGLFSPSSGILDVHAYMDSLAGDFRQNGGEIVVNSKVNRIRPLENGYKITLSREGSEENYSASLVINSAGLHADTVAGAAGIDIKSVAYVLHWCKGNYFRIPNKKEYRVKHLIYPVPPKNLAGLGVHATIDLQGGIKFGPDVNYLKEREKDFNVDENRKKEFLRSVHSYMPQIKVEDFNADMAGIRAKLQGPGDSFRDYIIHKETEKGLPGLINLIGIESPGLTASLAIAEYVGKMVF